MKISLRTKSTNLIKIFHDQNIWTESMNGYKMNRREIGKKSKQKQNSLIDCNIVNSVWFNYQLKHTYILFILFWFCELIAVFTYCSNEWKLIRFFGIFNKHFLTSPHSYYLIQLHIIFLSFWCLIRIQTWARAHSICVFFCSQKFTARSKILYVCIFLYLLSQPNAGC